MSSRGPFVAPGTPCAHDWCHLDAYFYVTYQRTGQVINLCQPHRHQLQSILYRVSDVEQLAVPPWRVQWQEVYDFLRAIGIAAHELTEIERKIDHIRDQWQVYDAGR